MPKDMADVGAAWAAAMRRSPQALPAQASSSPVTGRPRPTARMLAVIAAGRSKRARGFSRAPSATPLSSVALADPQDPNCRPYACGVDDCRQLWTSVNNQPGHDMAVHAEDATFRSCAELTAHLREMHPTLWANHTTTRTSKAASPTRESSQAGESADAEGGDGNLRLFACGLPGCGKSWTSANGLQYHIQRSRGGLDGHAAIRAQTIDREDVASSTSRAPTPASSAREQGREGSLDSVDSANASADGAESPSLTKKHKKKDPIAEDEQAWLCPLSATVVLSILHQSSSASPAQVAQLAHQAESPQSGFCTKRFRQRAGLAYHIAHAHTGFASQAIGISAHVGSSADLLAQAREAALRVALKTDEALMRRVALEIEKMRTALADTASPSGTGEIGGHAVALSSGMGSPIPIPHKGRGRPRKTV